MNKPHQIPEEFYSFDTGKPFEKCADCERDLLADDVEYSVSKIIRQYADYTAKDVIVEFAICTDCAGKLLEGISKDSLIVIQTYQLRVMLKVDSDFQVAMSKCIFSEKPKEQITTYQIIGFFNGKKPSEDSLPYLISNDELESLNVELSESTKDFFDEFYQNLIGPTPEWIKDNVPGGKLVLI